ncbi:hypothetical protein [Streptococcus equi]|uniref:Uncharacterized protein n=2 Tax=Streptococcus equi subsp. zooepidemicus TaxID=40041 RepID=C0MG64_STRS7|nr:hypothetical protein [Streptococcus equi]EQB23757.1 hypothetical protein M837_00819 [Streptococcus equi subsp. zooepidemicus SzS31A1]KIQ76035.1 hypothetical protein QQ41_03435 [Streptococcus equi subsp. zooepidemicus]MCD3376083.1 hypothetical protein [Streptococcus equi subsp. zooepidemicus]MCD3383916.1 hypothetical protein [Streptococcus equi subsp. zooepidemicus]MCD3392580.1 hypothetical protein [Streptococcus equi subsp. zooepidemicus]
MTITDKDYNELSNRVYNVDSGKEGVVHEQEGQEIMDGNFKILKAENNPDNGMQAMVVGAIKGGEVGKSHIMIVYAGINHLTAT